jgi:hypothetical protein
MSLEEERRCKEELQVNLGNPFLNLKMIGEDPVEMSYVSKKP